MSEDKKLDTKALNLLFSLYPDITMAIITHASEKLEPKQLVFFLKHLNDYFAINGDIGAERYGLYPYDKTSSDFLDEKIDQWLTFWKIEPNCELSNRGV